MHLLRIACGTIIQLSALGQLVVLGHCLDLQTFRNYSSSSEVNSTLVLPAQLLAIQFQSRKSLMHSYLPSLNVQMRARIRPYLSKSPAQIFTIFFSIKPAKMSFTFFPNYFASPFRVQGQSIPPILKVNLVGLLFSQTTALIVSPSVTLTTFPKKVLQLSENSSAQVRSRSFSYCQASKGCSLERVTPSGKKLLMAVSIISFLLRRRLPRFAGFLFFQLAEPECEEVYLSLQQRNQSLIPFCTLEYNSYFKQQILDEQTTQLREIQEKRKCEEGRMNLQWNV